MEGVKKFFTKLFGPEEKPQVSATTPQVRETPPAEYKLPISSRARCPCCKYPTLSERGSYGICELCNWEDDGQGDEDAHIVRGAPNADYSLTEARENFKRFRVMYTPDGDQRDPPGDSKLEYETKGKLMQLFDKLERTSPAEVSAIEVEIVRLEQVLTAELYRKVEEST